MKYIIAHGAPTEEPPIIVTPMPEVPAPEPIPQTAPQG